MPNKAPTSLAVVIPATDRPATLGHCVAAIKASTEPPDELVVIAEPSAGGPAAARNAGVAETTSEVVAFVDADVVVHPDALARLREAFAADPDLAAAFGSYDDAPRDPGIVSRFRNLLHHHIHTSAPGPADSFWAGLGAVRRRSFEAAGGFDAERFTTSAVEDIDLGMRIRAAGGRIALDPGIRGTHLKRWTLASMVRTDVLARGVPWLRLQLEAGRLAGSLNLGWRQRVGAANAVATTWAMLRRRPRGVLAGCAAELALEHRLYSLLRRRGGLALALAGLPLHLLHHLCSVLSVPLATVAHARSARGER
jgi:glycosyltransferase involved in cell wall biosynthesis